MFRSTTAALAALAIAGSVTGTTPAHAAADSYGVNFCAASSQDEVRGRCTMITTPGWYTLELIADARYSWARVQCTVTGEIDLLWVNLWDTDPDYPHGIDSGYLPGPECFLIVAAGNDGTAVGYVHP